MRECHFLKLGGSLLTDKTGIESVRESVLRRLAQEISAAREEKPGLQLVLGHGSGSFGHVPAARYGTRLGVKTPEEWVGFTKVSASALRLNRLVVESLLAAGVPAISLSPSASVQCEDGHITDIALPPIRQALAAGLLPVIHGDVAFDSVRGGTIVSTEEVMIALGGTLRPSWLLLAGETEGVYDGRGALIPEINAGNFSHIRSGLGGSRGTDVTGGMVAKVESMLALAAAFPFIKVRIFSGLEMGAVQQLVQAPATEKGTLITSA